MELTLFEGNEWEFSTDFNGYIISGYKTTQINHPDGIRDYTFLRHISITSKRGNLSYYIQGKLTYVRHSVLSLL